MTILRRTLAVLLLLAATAGTAPLMAQQPAPTVPEQQDEFIPIDQLPPQDQLPAAPLLIGAYAFVLVALFLYVFSIARRLATVQREVERLEGDMKRSARG
jgi:CcmD family protein